MVSNLTRAQQLALYQRDGNMNYFLPYTTPSVPVGHEQGYVRETGGPLNALRDLLHSDYPPSPGQLPFNLPPRDHRGVPMPRGSKGHGRTPSRDIMGGERIVPHAQPVVSDPVTQIFQNSGLIPPTADIPLAVFTNLGVAAASRAASRQVPVGELIAMQRFASFHGDIADTVIKGSAEFVAAPLTTAIALADVVDVQSASSARNGADVQESLFSHIRIEFSNTNDDGRSRFPIKFRVSFYLYNYPVQVTLTEHVITQGADIGGQYDLIPHALLGDDLVIKPGVIDATHSVEVELLTAPPGTIAVVTIPSVKDPKSQHLNALTS